MSAPAHTITQQREAVECLINAALERAPIPLSAGSPIFEAAKKAVLTLAWIERRADLVKEVERLEREAPQLATLLREFPGAKISEVR